MKLQLIRREKEQYVLGFPVYSAADLGKIREVTGRYATSLADALLARRKEIEAVLPACCAGRGPARCRVHRAGVRVVGLGRLGPGGQEALSHDGEAAGRSLWGLGPGEIGPDTDRIYWSSGTLSYGDALLVSFGDGHARYLSGLRNPPAPLKARQASQYAVKCLLALRNGDRSLDELRSALGITPAEARSLAELLAGLEFVTLQDGRYQAHIPVFSRSDKKAVQQSGRSAAR